MKISKYYTVESKTISSAKRKIKVLIIRPTKSAKPKQQTPGVLWIHGGGYATGMAEMAFRTRAIDLVKKYGAVVVTPNYTLSCKEPFPAALEDCYATLKYLKDHADELNVNSSQLMVGGESAGGGLTVSLCMYARDKGEVNIAYQMPLYPMIDDRDTDSSRNNHSMVWSTKKNHKAWKAYLGELWKKEVPYYAAPARATDYSNLPPAYTFVSDTEPFYNETLTYIQNLNNAGVKAKVNVYPNCSHAFDMFFPLKKVSRIAIAEFENEYLYATKNYFAKQKE